MRKSVGTLYALGIAIAIAGVGVGQTPLTLTNTATGGPATATMSAGGQHSLDQQNAKVGGISCMFSTVSPVAYLPTQAALNPGSTGAGGPNATPGFTVQWWYKVSAPTTFGYLWGEVQWSSFRCFQNGAAGVGNVIIRGPLTDLTTTGAPLQNATDPQGWVHLALVVNSQANTSTWYVNGAQNASGPANITGQGTNLAHFGYDGSSGPGTCNFDDVRIYDWARTGPDIAADYLVSAGGFGPSGSPNTPDLGYYECEATTLRGSGTGNPGTTITFGLDAPQSPGLPYQMASSLGTGPIPIGSRSLRLSIDPLFTGSVGGTLPQVFVNYTGVIGASGRAGASLNIPPFQFLKGNTIHTAFVTFDPQAPQGVRSISSTYTFMIN